MAPAELSKLCAHEIQQQYLHGSTIATLAQIAEPLIRGAIQRALDEQGGVDRAHLVALGAVDVKVTKSTQGVSLEVDCKRGREPGETYEQAAEASARLAAGAYAAALEEITSIGLVPGKERA